ncbi:MAG TPA: hypothetical protein PK906_17035, partial [Spirochaetota bacterium]|nr:hypothetical protein [Spirochaetota bacterium]
MKKFRILYFIILTAIIFLSPAPPVYSSDPVTLEETKFHATILKDGKLEVLYTITFTEHQNRDRIRSIGQFIEPMVIIESWGVSKGKKFKVTMSSNGNGYYAAIFNTRTVSDSKYSINIRYRVDKSVVSGTKKDGVDYAAFWWPPIQWDLPIKKQVVQIITPVEIPRKYRKAEQIKDDLVNKSGIIANTDTVNKNDRWIYYPSLWKGKNYLSLHIEKKNLGRRYKQDVSFFYPGKYTSIGAEGGTYTLDSFSAGNIIEEGDFTINSGSAFINILPKINDARSINDKTTYFAVIREDGKRNIYRRLVKSERTLAYTKVSVFNGITYKKPSKSITAKFRYYVDEDGNKDYRHFDLITSRPVEKGEILAYMFRVQGLSSKEYNFEKRLFDDRFKINYLYQGISLSKPFKGLILSINQPFKGKSGEEHFADYNKSRPFTVKTGDLELFKEWQYIENVKDAEAGEIDKAVSFRAQSV